MLGGRPKTAETAGRAGCPRCCGFQWRSDIGCQGSGSCCWEFWNAIAFTGKVLGGRCKLSKTCLERLLAAVREAFQVAAPRFQNSRACNYKCTPTFFVHMDTWRASSWNTDTTTNMVVSLCGKSNNSGTDFVCCIAIIVKVICLGSFKRKGLGSDCTCTYFTPSAVSFGGHLTCYCISSEWMRAASSRLLLLPVNEVTCQIPVKQKLCIDSLYLLLVGKEESSCVNTRSEWNQVGSVLWQQ